MSVPRKETRSAVLYARIKPSNRAWVSAEARRLGYKREAEFVDAVLSDVRARKTALDRKQK
jgi:hypothetical protein